MPILGGSTGRDLGPSRQGAELPGIFPRIMDISMSSRTAGPVGQPAAKHRLAAGGGKELPLFPFILPVVFKNDKKCMHVSKYVARFTGLSVYVAL